MNKILIISFFTCLIFICFHAQAKIINVPGDKITIQGAINYASDGDTILIADGTYRGFWNRDIEFKGKAVTVTSAHGHEFTVIDCEGSSGSEHRGFCFIGGEGTSSKVTGLTIINGYFESEHGGGIYCESSSPTIEGCIFNSNTAYYGGGIYCSSSKAVIKDNLFIFNTSLGT